MEQAAPGYDPAPYGSLGENSGFVASEKPEAEATTLLTNNLGTATSNSQKDGPLSARWGVSWQFPALVTGLFIGSLLFAVGHHLYYDKLSNTVVQSDSQQAWAIRIGTGLAFVTRMGLTIVVGIAGAQQLWLTLRRKAISIADIDGMFDLLRDPIALFRRGVLVHAKTLSLIALVSWSIPLIAIIAPSALSVRLQMVNNTTEMVVQTVNMSDTLDWASYSGPGYVQDPSIDIKRLFTLVSSSGQIYPQPALFSNASYDLQFWGASYACQNLSDTIATQNDRTWTSPNYTSLQDVWFHEAGNITVDVFDGDSFSSYFYSAGAPKYLNNMILIYANGFNSEWGGTPKKGTNLTCQLYNTSYDITISFENGVQYVRENSIELFERMSWNDTVGFMSALNYRDTPSLETFYVTHMLFRQLLSGTIALSADGEVSTFEDDDTLPILQSALVDCPELWNTTVVNTASSGDVWLSPTKYGCHEGSLARAIEQLSRNFTYTLMTFPQWLGVHNANSSMTVSTMQNVFVYNGWTLWGPYLAGLAATLMCVGVGALAVFKNGIASSNTFSNIMFTTRNADLDTIAVGQCLGDTRLPSEIGSRKLQFGAVDSGEGYEHAAFGVEGTVKPLRKGDVYF